MNVTTNCCSADVRISIMMRTFSATARCCTGPPRGDLKLPTTTTIPLFLLLLLPTLPRRWGQMDFETISANELLETSACDICKQTDACSQCRCCCNAYGEMAETAGIDSYNYWCCAVAWSSIAGGGIGAICCGIIPGIMMYPIGTCTYRQRLRLKITGQPETSAQCCTNWCEHMWCPACTLVQDYHLSRKVGSVALMTRV